MSSHGEEGKEGGEGVPGPSSGIRAFVPPSGGQKRPGSFIAFLLEMKVGGYLCLSKLSRLKVDLRPSPDFQRSWSSSGGGRGGGGSASFPLHAKSDVFPQKADEKNNQAAFRSQLSRRSHARPMTVFQQHQSICRRSLWCLAAVLWRPSSRPRRLSGWNEDREKKKKMAVV